MIIALFALAAVMIVGGIASVVQGFPFVRLESGLAMTIAGAATASAGAVLLGIAVVALRLKRLEQVLAERALVDAPAFDRALPDHAAAADDTATDRPGILPQGPDLFDEPGRVEPPSLAMPDRPVLPARQDDAPAGRQRPRVPGFRAAASPPSFAEDVAVGMPPPGSDPAAPLLPDLLPEPPPPAEAPPPRPEPAIAADASGQALRRMKPARPTPMVDTVIPVPEPAALTPEPPAPAPVAPGTDAEEPLALRPSDAGQPDPAPAMPARPEVPPAEPMREALQVVGTYASGGNTYVMFSDGSIKADTPRGQFTFDSLDELKDFVEAGGEADARGAA